MRYLDFGQVDANRAILHAKTAVPNVVSAHQADYGQPLTRAHIQGREADIRAVSELNHALDKKVIMLFDRLNCLYSFEFISRINTILERSYK